MRKQDRTEQGSKEDMIEEEAKLRKLKKRRL